MRAFGAPRRGFERALDALRTYHIVETLAGTVVEDADGNVVARIEDDGVGSDFARVLLRLTEGE